MKHVIAIAVCLCWFPATGQFQPGRSRSFSAQPSAASYFGGLVSTNGLRAYWRMDESSDGSAAVTRNDSFGTNHLTDASAFAASATGIITNGVDLESTVNSEYLTIDDNANISFTSGTSFSITGWVKPESLATRALLCKANATGNGTEYFLFWNASGDLSFRVGDGTSNATTTVLGAMSAGNWYFFAAVCDLTDNELRLSINSGTNAVATWTGDVQDLAGPMEVGRITYSTGTNRGDGVYDELALWGIELSETDIDNLYGGGAGNDL